MKVRFLCTSWLQQSLDYSVSHKFFYFFMQSPPKYLLNIDVKLTLCSSDKCLDKMNLHAKLGHIVLIKVLVLLL